MSSEALKSFIAKERSSGTQDQDIFLKMLDTPAFRAGIEKGNKQGLTNRQIAAGIGLKLPERKAVDVTQIKKDAMLGAAKKEGKTAAWESGLLGFSDLGAGVVQGATYTADGISGLSNKLLGTNLDAKAYERFTKQRKETDDWHKLKREANEQGFDWMRLGGQIAGTAPMAALGRGYQGAKVLSAAGAKVAGQNALVGAGIGGASFAEDADTRLAHTALGAVGGAAGGAVGEKIGQGIGKAIQVGKDVSSRFSTTQTNQLLTQINQRLDDVLRPSGLSLSNLSDDVANSLRQEALSALRSGKDVNPTSVARKVVLERLGLKGTKAQVSGDAKQWQNQAELAKIERSGDPLRDKFIDDNVQLTRLLNEAADSTGGRSFDGRGAMDDALTSIKGQLGQNKDYIRTIYNSARQANGNDVKLGGAEFVSEARKALKDNYSTMELPASINSILKRFEKNPDEFTLGESEAVIKKLNQAHQASLKPDGTNSSETYAIGLVRDVLNNRQAQSLQSLASQSNHAAELYQLGRQAHKFNAEQINSMPLLQDAVKGTEPDKLFSKHVLGGNVNELNKTIELLNNISPQSVNNIKQQVVEYISKRSINSNGQFSPAGMKRALDKITDNRLLTMFSPKEFAQIKDISKAADYLMTQPPHSYVNNSNTASTLANHFMTLLKLPGVRVVLSSVKDVPDSIATKGAMKPSIVGDKIQERATQDLIERLTRAGLMSGSNLPNQ